MFYFAIKTVAVGSVSTLLIHHIHELTNLYKLEWVTKVTVNNIITHFACSFAKKKKIKGKVGLHVW